jgi:hypothetical protein
MTYATDGDRYARPLPAPVRVERRAHTAKTWQPVTDVLAWDGRVLVVQDVPGYVLVSGARWRIGGHEYDQGLVRTDGPIKVTLRRAA